VAPESASGPDGRVSDGMTVVTEMLDPGAPGGDDLTIIFGERRRTRASLRAAALNVSAGLRRAGVLRGDRVAVLSAGRMEVLDTFFGVAYAGAINVVLNAFLKSDMLAYQLRVTTPRVAVTDEAGARAIAAIKHELDDPPAVINLDEPADLAELLRAPSADAAVERPAPSDPVSIVFTSGTTGRSKGCVLSHQYFVEVGLRIAENFPLSPSDLFYTPYPLFHIGGQCAALAHALVTGASVAFEPEFHASEFWDRARALGATYSQGTGAVGMALLAQPPSARDQDHSLRFVSWIPMAAEAAEAFAKRFGVRVVSEWYGQTEMSPISMNLGYARNERCQGSMGFPLPDVEVRVAGDDGEPVPAGTAGELLVRPRRGGIMFSGYWAQPEQTVASWRDLWYHTGDIVLAEPDGSLSFVDRKTDSIRRSGENVSCFEVEQVLMRLTGVSQVAVHAVPADLIEDEIKAWIVAAPGARLSPRDVFEYCSSRLPYFAIPRFLEFSSELPLNAMGKVVKDTLRSAGMTGSQHDLKALGLVLERSQRRGTVAP